MQQPEINNQHSQWEGKRIIEYECLGKSLWCNRCDLPLSTLDIVQERIIGFASTLRVKCRFCNQIKQVDTQKKCGDKLQYFVMNIKMPMGTK